MSVGDSRPIAILPAAGTVATAMLADGAVTGTKIASATVATGNMVDGAITDAKMTSVDASKVLNGMGAVISAQLLAAPATSIVFASIPQTYRYLRLALVARSAKAAAASTFVLCYVNADTTVANYQDQALDQAGAASAGAYQNNGNNAGVQIGQIPAATATANWFGVTRVDILNYASASLMTAFLSQSGQNGAAAIGNLVSHGLHLAAAAATQLTLTNGAADNFATGTLAVLYGMN